MSDDTVRGYLNSAKLLRELVGLAADLSLDEMDVAALETGAKACEALAQPAAREVGEAVGQILRIDDGTARVALFHDSLKENDFLYAHTLPAPAAGVYTSVNGDTCGTPAELAAHAADDATQQVAADGLPELPPMPKPSVFDIVYGNVFSAEQMHAIRDAGIAYGRQLGRASR